MSGREASVGKGGRGAACTLLAMILAGAGAGCTSLSSGISAGVADLPAPIGLPPGTPSRPAVAPEYPAVHDIPPPRDNKLLTEEERVKLEQDLAAARDRTGRHSPPKKGKNPS